MERGTLGWLGIVRLGLVQSAIGAIVVLVTSTLNRVMVVEMALPACRPHSSPGTIWSRSPVRAGAMALIGAGAARR